MKSAIVEREVGDAAAERSVLNEALAKFSTFWKLWMMLGQLEERVGECSTFDCQCLFKA